MTAPARLRFAAGFDASPIPGVGDPDYADIEKRSGIRHGHHYGHSACLVAVTAKKLAELPSHRPGRLGIICNGGPLALRAAWTMLDRARSAGAELINPLQFPPTLVSAAATSAASVVGGHAFAYVAGHDHFAFFEVLRRAAQAVRLCIADQVFAIAVVARDASVETAAARANITLRADVAMGFCVDLASADSGNLLLLGFGTHEEIMDTWPDASRYEAFWEDETLCCSWDLPVQDVGCLGATGAVLLHLAASRQKNLKPSARDNVFTVSMRTEARSIALAARICA